MSFREHFLQTTALPILQKHGIRLEEIQTALPISTRRAALQEIRNTSPAISIEWLANIL